MGERRLMADEQRSAERDAKELDDVADREELRKRYEMLLQELRVVLPGVQVLMAFLLTAPFAQRFDDLDDTGRRAYLVALVSALASTICLLTPTVFHRVADRTATTGSPRVERPPRRGRHRAPGHLPDGSDVVHHPAGVRSDVGNHRRRWRPSSPSSPCGSPSRSASGVPAQRLNASAGRCVQAAAKNSCSSTTPSSSADSTTGALGTLDAVVGEHDVERADDHDRCRRPVVPRAESSPDFVTP